MNHILDVTRFLLQNKFIVANKLNDEDNSYIEIIVSKLDVDGMLFVYQKAIDIRDYLIENTYINFIQEMSYEISRLLHNRKIAVIGDCEHEFVMIGNDKGCRKCMGRFGVIVELNQSMN